MGTTNSTALSLCAGPFDHLSDSALEERMDKWSRATSDLVQKSDVIEHYYNTISYRSIFLKNLPDRAVVLDMGAGEGSLSIYKSWPEIARPDLDLYGVSLDPIARADAYKAVSITNYETNPDPFNGVKFDAVLASHFIEHLSDPTTFIEWAAASMNEGGRMYLEWPHEFTKRLPTRQFFMDRGINTYTTNFFDDLTHVQTWSAEKIIEIASKNGLSVESVGRFVFPFMAEKLRDAARADGDMIKGTFSVWCAVGFAQYLVLNKR